MCHRATWCVTRQWVSSSSACFSVQFVAHVRDGVQRHLGPTQQLEVLQRQKSGTVMVSCEEGVSPQEEGKHRAPRPIPCVPHGLRLPRLLHSLSRCPSLVHMLSRCVSVV